MAEEMTSLPPISSLTSLPRSTHESILSLLFEPSPSLQTVCAPVLGSTEFSSYPEMIAAVGIRLQELAKSNDLETLDDILSSHPRLGEKKVDSALSRAEQAAMAKASAGSSDAEKEQETLRVLNADYEKAFPGLRYV
jgi:2-oxo-4-hydroxy-4-carboxy--5-ureidoimidazoline (OHCU) decarboxylase